MATNKPASPRPAPAPAIAKPAAKPVAAAPAVAQPKPAQPVAPAQTLVADQPPPALEIPFGSPAQVAAEKQAAAVAQAAAPTFLPGKRTEHRTVPPFGELTLLLFGKPGSGKTVFAASNPGAYFLSLEPGQHFTDAASVEIKKWAEFQAHVVAIHNAKSSGQFEYNTCVVDIIDILSGYCRDFICHKKGLAYPPENDFGKTWKEVREEWQKWVRGLMRTVNVVFITHCNESPREITLDNGMKQEVAVSHPTFAGGMGGKMGEYLDGVVNAMGHLRIKGNGKHAISFLKDAKTDAKDRTDILSKLGEIELSANPKQNWARVTGAYNAKAKELGFEVKSLWLPGQTHF